MSQRKQVNAYEDGGLGGHCCESRGIDYAVHTQTGMEADVICDEQVINV